MEVARVLPGDELVLRPTFKQGMTVHSLSRPTSMIWAEQSYTTLVWQLDDIVESPRPSRRPFRPASLRYSGHALSDHW